MDRRVSRELMQRLRADALRIASHFGLQYRALEAERGGVNGHYGICYSDGTIRIRLRHAVSGKPLKYSSLVNTLCHELAHLRHFNHGPRFKAFYLQMLAWARSEGLYQPTPSRVATGAVRTGSRTAPHGRARAPSDRMPRPQISKPLISEPVGKVERGDEAGPADPRPPEQLSLF